MAALGKIRIGMTVLDRKGAIIGVVKALELAEGVKPPLNLVLGGTRDRVILEAGTREIKRTNRLRGEGHLLIETKEGKEIVESLESIHRIADTAVHLAVVGQTDEPSDGSFEGRISPFQTHSKADRP